MKRHFCFILVMLSASICFTACSSGSTAKATGDTAIEQTQNEEQEGKSTDYSFFNLKGKVKSVIINIQKWSNDEKSYYDESIDTLHFSEDGLIISGINEGIDYSNSSISRNEQGLIQKIKFEDEFENDIDEVFVWKDDFVIERNSSRSGEFSVSSTIKYKYDAKGNCTLELIEGVSEGNEYSETHSYEYKSFDANDNWTECIMHSVQTIEEPEDYEDPESEIIKTEYKEQFKIVRKVQYY